MRSRLCVVLASFLAVPFVGCGPSVSDDELGRVIHDVPEIPKGYEPYKLPSLVATDPDQSEANAASDSQAEKDVQSSPDGLSQ